MRSFADGREKFAPSPTPLASPFRVFVCAELRRDKINLELAFPVQPSLHSLFHRIADAFTELKRSPEAAMASSDLAPFYIGQVAILAPSREAWLPLVTDAQIEPNCQLYAFQPVGTPGVVDVIGELPPPIREPSHQLHSVLMLPVFDQPTKPVAPSLVPKRKDTAAVPNILFDLLDEDRDGIVTLFQLRDAMEDAGLDTSPQAVGRSFTLGDRRLQRDQFRGFYDEYPKAAAELHSKLLAKKAPHQHLYQQQARGRSSSPKQRRRHPSGSPSRREALVASSPPSALRPTAIMSPAIAASGGSSGGKQLFARDEEVAELRMREKVLVDQLRAVQKRLAELAKGDD